MQAPIYQNNTVGRDQLVDSKVHTEAVHLRYLSRCCRVRETRLVRLLLRVVIAPNQLQNGQVITDHLQQCIHLPVLMQLMK